MHACWLVEHDGLGACTADFVHQLMRVTLNGVFHQSASFIFIVLA